MTRLLRLFPFSGFSEALSGRYNEQSQSEYERIRDFIVLHYKATERDDTPYWRDCRDMEVPETLAQRIALFRETGQVYQGADEIFRVDSWLQVLLGQRIEPKAYHHFAHLSDAETMKTSLDTLKSRITAAVEKLPTHKDFLDSYCGPLPE
ncbi:MAG: tryptophan 7-halogenase [Terricaulis sp.]